MNETERAEIFRRLPSIDLILQGAAAARIRRETGIKQLTRLARTAAQMLRGEIGNANGATVYSRENLLAAAELNLEKLWRDECGAGLQRVINATGVVIHTNLGRAPLSENARRALIETASGYCNLEYDLPLGRRGKRGARAERLLAELTGAEGALIVNNCAAATFLVLTVLARGGEVIISRGEMVEIGGDFRVPDVMEQSGARLREVGATNRTKIADYEQAINENTKLLLKVHPSNYRIVGFTEMPPLGDLAELAHQRDVLLYEDAGSGALFDLSEYGLIDEPIIADSISAGVDVVTFSGDKLLGGAQSGLIVGRREVIEKIRKHPLYRALRVDKLIYAVLEATLQSFSRENAVREIPVLKMLSMTETEIAERTIKFAFDLKAQSNGDNALHCEVIEGNSVIGGGSAPLVHPKTKLLALTHRNFSAAHLEEKLRLSKPPIIARILEDKVLIDLRTVAENEEAELLKSLLDVDVFEA